MEKEQKKSKKVPKVASWEAFLVSLYAPLPALREMAVLELPVWASFGRDVRDLLLISLKDENAIVSRAAAVVIGRLRLSTPDILEGLERCLASQDDLLRRTIVTTLSRLGPVAIPYLIRLLGDRDSFARQFSGVALRQIGKDSIPALVEALTDENLRRCSADVLVELGDVAVPHVLKLVDHEVPEVRFTALDILERVGPVVIPGLIGQIRQSGSGNEMAGDALVRFGQDAIPELVKTLQDKEVNTRCWAAALLVRIGIPAIPALIGQLNEKNVSISWLASKALVQIGPSAIPHLIDWLGTTTRSIRWIISDVLIQLGEESMHALERALRDPNPVIRETAAFSLGEMGHVGWAALPALKELVKVEKDSHIREVASRSVDKLHLYD